VILVFLGVILSTCSSKITTIKPAPSSREHHYTLGSSSVVIKKITYTVGMPVLFLQLHHNENTAAEVAGIFSAKHGIDFMQIANNGNRLISFEQNKISYRFDPNRIFSEAGIKNSLALQSSYAKDAYEAVYRFREFLLDMLDAKKTIVAVHNNTNGEFSIHQYQQNNSGLVHVNATRDMDDFFITTDSRLFYLLKEKNFNVVLEYPERLKDDGSLSIFCAKNDRRYVNVEAEHGHRREQAEMIETLLQLLK